MDTKNISPSVFDWEMHSNWLIFLTLSSFEIQIPSEYFHCSAKLTLVTSKRYEKLWAALINFTRRVIWTWSRC